jgi:hypothetical protein
LSAIEFLRSKWRKILVIDGEGSVEEVAERFQAEIIIYSGER